MQLTLIQLFDSLTRDSIDKDITNYMISTSLKYKSKDNFNELATNIYKDLSISNISEENKNNVIIISNDVKFLLGKPLNDKNAGISTFVKTVPVLLNIYNYSDTLPTDQQQLVENYVYTNIKMDSKDYLKIPESGFLEIADKLNKSSYKSLPIEVQNKLREFGLDYKNAVLSKPVLKGNSNLLIIIIILLILIGLGFFYFKSKSKVSFGKRRRRV